MLCGLRQLGHELTTVPLPQERPRFAPIVGPTFVETFQVRSSSISEEKVWLWLVTTACLQAERSMLINSSEYVCHVWLLAVSLSIKQYLQGARPPYVYASMLSPYGMHPQ